MVAGEIRAVSGNGGAGKIYHLLLHVQVAGPVQLSTQLVLGMVSIQSGKLSVVPDLVSAKWIDTSSWGLACFRT